MAQFMPNHAVNGAPKKPYFDPAAMQANPMATGYELYSHPPTSTQMLEKAGV